MHRIPDHSLKSRRKTPLRIAKDVLVCTAGVGLSAAVLSVGCHGWIKAPYDLGLVIGASDTVVTDQIFYKNTPAGVVEQKGTLGAGSDCGVANMSTGIHRVHSEQTRTIDWEVVGETPWDHPLLPGNDYSRTMLSVIQEMVVSDGTTNEEESFVVVNPDGIVAYQDTTDQYTGRTTDASYYGMAVDEYLIKVTSLDMWNNLEDSGRNQGPLAVNTATDWLGVNGSATQTVQLLTKHKPKKYDMWSSTNGDFLYFFDDTEKMPVGGKDVKADRIVITTTGNVDPAASTLVDNCLNVGLYSYTTNNPDTDVLDDVVNVAHLDAGCGGDFVHQMVGTQWWYKDVLVKAQTTTYIVNISDWGYEWTEFDDSLTTCTRMTSNRQDSPTATLFVEYDVTTVVSNYQVNTWTEKKKKDSGPSGATAGGGGGDAGGTTG